MCRAVRCKTCSKTTWAGCGQHVANVRSVVSAGQWCAGVHSTAEKLAATEARSGGFLAKLVRRI